MNADLSRWDVVSEFSARDAACLALGIDPADPAAQAWKAEPILRVMRWHYEMTVAYAADQLTRVVHNPALSAQQRRRPALDGLVGRRLRAIWLAPAAPEGRSPAEVAAPLKAEVDDELFSRSELCSFFASVDITSEYDFAARAPLPLLLPNDAPDPDHRGETAIPGEFQVQAYVDTGQEPDDVPGASDQAVSGASSLRPVTLLVMGYRELLHSASRRSSRASSSSTGSRTAFKGKMALQEDRLVDIIRDLGHDPTSLPPARRSGGVKSKVGEIALGDAKLFTKTTFPAAWKRLRKAGRIGGGRIGGGGCR